MCSIHRVLIIVVASTSACATARAPAVSEAELVRHTQELFDSVAAGDQAPWTRYFADDALFCDETGRIMDKRALVADVTPLPSGYGGSIKVVHVQSRIAGATAILSYDLDEQESVFGQQLTARYHGTNTWLHRDGKWQIVAGQTLRYYEDPGAGSVDPKRLAEYAGSYALAPNVRAVISLEGGALYLARDGRPKVVLVPEVDGLFFRKGVEGRRLFRRGSDGKIDAMIDRRNNQDLVWKRMP